MDLFKNVTVSFRFYNIFLSFSFNIVMFLYNFPVSYVINKIKDTNKMHKIYYILYNIICIDISKFLYSHTNICIHLYTDLYIVSYRRLLL